MLRVTALVTLILITYQISTATTTSSSSSASSSASCSIKNNKKTNTLGDNNSTTEGSIIKKSPTNMNNKEKSELLLVLGGGAINEKERRSTNNVCKDDKEEEDRTRTNYEPDRNICHLLHSIVGLDRYPNYISRWSSNINDITHLEESLQQTLELVQNQKKKLLNQQKIVRNVIEDRDDGSMTLLQVPTSWEQLRDEVLHPNAYNAIMNSKAFQKRKNKKQPPKLQDVLDGKVNMHYESSILAQWLFQQQEEDDEEEEDLPDDVYSFPIFSNAFCNKLTNVFQHTIQSISNKVSSSTDEDEMKATALLKSRPIDLDMIGLGWINNLLLHLVIQPLSSQLSFPQRISQSTKPKLDWRQGYMTGYSNTPTKSNGLARNRLVSHTDDSEITLNICLGCKFKGGKLIFSGVRGSTEENQNKGEYAPKLGYGIIHSGRHLHQVSPVTDGNRYVLILWARSWSDVRSITCPCCWLNNRRFDDSCICDSKWN